MSKIKYVYIDEDEEAEEKKAYVKPLLVGPLYIQFCCVPMEEAIAKGDIGNVHYRPGSRTINIFAGTEIFFCPWCAAPIIRGV